MPSETSCQRRCDDHPPPVLRRNSAAIYDPQRFVLTDNQGIEYLLDVDEGLLETTDRNGNKVVYSADGIFPDRGIGVDFVRDTDGRITQLVLPRGEISYTYDSAGDLVSVVDEEGVATAFSYDSAHRLTSYGKTH